MSRVPQKMAHPAQSQSQVSPNRDKSQQEMPRESDSNEYLEIYSIYGSYGESAEKSEFKGVNVDRTSAVGESNSQKRNHYNSGLASFKKSKNLKIQTAATKANAMVDQNKLFHLSGQGDGIVNEENSDRDTLVSDDEISSDIIISKRINTDIAGPGHGTKQSSMSIFSTVYQELASAMDYEEKEKRTDYLKDRMDELVDERASFRISPTVTSKIFKLPSSTSLSSAIVEEEKSTFPTNGAINVNTSFSKYKAANTTLDITSPDNLLSPPRTPKRKDSLPGPAIQPRRESIIMPTRSSSKNASPLPLPAINSSKKQSSKTNFAPPSPISSPESSRNSSLANDQSTSSSILEMYASLASLQDPKFQESYIYQSHLQVSINHSAPLHKYCALSADPSPALLIFSSFEDRDEFDYMTLDAACSVSLSRKNQIMIQDQAENIVVVQGDEAEGIRIWYNVLKSAVEGSLGPATPSYGGHHGVGQGGSARRNSVAVGARSRPVLGLFGRILGRRPSEPY